jgi:glycosyltransferase involved in cell wall biosynthesis
MRESHFLFLPTRAEAFGMSLCEANAFGVPVITTATGGVPSIVRDGENGFALPLAADAEAYAGQILRLFREPALYRTLAESSFREFERRLNWRTFCERYLELVEQRLGIPLRPSDSAAKPAAPSKAPALAKIGFLANDYINPESVSSWSGLPFYIAQGLRAAGYEVVPIRALGIGNSRWSRVKKALWRLVGRRYLPALEPAAMREYADVISGKISEVQPDLLFSLSSRFLVNLHVKVPTIFWTDATFAGMVDFYESFCRLTPATLANGRAAEQDALSRTSYAIYASDWAAQTAIEHYRVEPQKVRVVPFGANLSDEPKLADLEEAIARRKAGGGECRLLLMGVDWERKGASVAVEAAVELNRLGISTRLRVAGCRPPFRQKLPDCVELLGFLDKQSVAGRAQIAALYLESHFLIVPSRAEAYGVVFCEANAFGVPCLATEVGGIPTIIQNEVNGRLFDLHAHGREYAEWIADIWKDPARYQELALGSRRRYDERLCWSASIQQIAGLISTLLPEAPANERTEVPETLLQP